MPIKLKSEEQDLLREELADFAATLPEGEVPPPFSAMVAAVEAGELPDEVLHDIGRLLEIQLQTGHVRQVHRAAGEQTLLRLYNQTPPGRARATSLAEVNRALEQLAGQEIETVRAVARGPGSVLLMISTNACEITLRFTPEDVGVESVAVGV
ncbi:MAG TPA: hypothetical protein VHS99_27325 [Chloroflexota bacterium]|jgi:hypothetical protein|nr:hypothetical protein [Chloroflexota bacterium]